MLALCGCVYSMGQITRFCVVIILFSTRCALSSKSHYKTVSITPTTKLRLKYPQNWNNSIFQTPPLPRSGPYSNPWHICSLGLGSTLLGRPCARLKTSYTHHLHTVANKAIAVLCNIFHFLAQDSTFTVQKANPLQIAHLSILRPLLSAVLHVLPTTWTSKLCNQGVSESLVIIPDVLSLPSYTTF
jgi:hypothetical protein